MYNVLTAETLTLHFLSRRNELRYMAPDPAFKKRAELMIGICLMMTMFFSLASCGSSAQGREASSEETRRIIIDTDAGADDAAAIILAAKNSGVAIEGVTVLAGNVDVEQAAKNALTALETAGATAPVYRGASESAAGVKWDPYSVFGEDGMGDADLVHPSGKAEDGDAVDFILETVRNDPGGIEIMVLGPATNIANAIQKDPETMKQVKMIWSMGTTGLGPGNATPVAEFNVYSDPEAYKIMLDSGIPVTVTGLDMCMGDSMWSDEQFRKLEASGDAGAFLSKAFAKIRDFYRGNGEESVAVCDPVALLCAMDEDFLRDSITCHGSCITEEGETYGEVLFYKKGFTYDWDVPEGLVYNVRLVTDVDRTGYFDRYLRGIK